jgi:hypothetical protein
MTKYKDGLYNVALGLPVLNFKGLGPIRLIYSRHAQQAALNDRYGHINLPTVLNPMHAELIEVEMSGGAPVKAVFRLPLDDRRDICLVVLPSGLVKTVWVNLASDAHKTLDASKYVSLRKAA